MLTWPRHSPFAAVDSVPEFRTATLLNAAAEFSACAANVAGSLTVELERHRTASGMHESGLSDDCERRMAEHVRELLCDCQTLVGLANRLPPEALQAYRSARLKQFPTGNQARIRWRRNLNTPEFSPTPDRDNLVYHGPIQGFGDITAPSVHEFIRELAFGFVQAFEFFESTSEHLCELLDGLANFTDLLEFMDDHADRSTLELEFASAYPSAGTTQLEDSGEVESQTTPNEAAIVADLQVDTDEVHSELMGVISQFQRLPARADDLDWTIYHATPDGEPFLPTVPDDGMSDLKWPGESRSHVGDKLRKITRVECDRERDDDDCNAADLWARFKRLGMIVPDLLTRDFVTPETREFCESVDRDGFLWCRFVVALSRQKNCSIPECESVWPVESDAGITYYQERELPLPKHPHNPWQPPIPEEWNCSAPEFIFAFLKVKLGELSQSVCKWLCEELKPSVGSQESVTAIDNQPPSTADRPVSSNLQRPMSAEALLNEVFRQQSLDMKDAERTVRRVIDAVWPLGTSNYDQPLRESAESANEDSVRHPLNVSDAAKIAVTALRRFPFPETSTSLPPLESAPKYRVEFIPGQDEHDSVKELLAVLPDSEVRFDEVNSRLFAHDEDRWPQLVNLSRLPDSTAATLQPIVRDFASWIEQRYVPTEPESEHQGVVRLNMTIADGQHRSDDPDSALVDAILRELRRSVKDRPHTEGKVQTLILKSCARIEAMRGKWYSVTYLAKDSGMHYRSAQIVLRLLADAGEWTPDY